MGGDGKDTEGYGEKNPGTGPEYKQRGGSRRTGMVENESQKGHAQIEVLVETDSNEPKAPAEESLRLGDEEGYQENLDELHQKAIEGNWAGGILGQPKGWPEPKRLE